MAAGRGEQAETPRLGRGVALIRPLRRLSDEGCEARLRPFTNRRRRSTFCARALALTGKRVRPVANPYNDDHQRVQRALSTPSCLPSPLSFRREHGPRSRRTKITSYRSHVSCARTRFDVLHGAIKSDRRLKGRDRIERGSIRNRLISIPLCDHFWSFERHVANLLSRAVARLSRIVGREFFRSRSYCRHHDASLTACSCKLILNQI